MLLQNAEWERDGKKLDLEGLSQGPQVFMPKGQRPGRLDELMDFLMEFVAKSEGQNRINELMKKNRGARRTCHI